MVIGFFIFMAVIFLIGAVSAKANPEEATKIEQEIINRARNGNFAQNVAGSFIKTDNTKSKIDLYVDTIFDRKWILPIDHTLTAHVKPVAKELFEEIEDNFSKLSKNDKMDTLVDFYALNVSKIEEWTKAGDIARPHFARVRWIQYFLIEKYGKETLKNHGYKNGYWHRMIKVK